MTLYVGLSRFPTHPVFIVQFGWPAATEIMKALSKFSWQINLESLFDLHNPQGSYAGRQKVKIPHSRNDPISKSDYVNL